VRIVMICVIFVSFSMVIDDNYRVKHIGLTFVEDNALGWWVIFRDLLGRLGSSFCLPSC
jgi:hypothetical protein